MLDLTYPNTLDDAASAALSSKYAAQIHHDASAIDGFKRLEEVDLHPGYSLPGFLLEYGWAFGASAVALFMSGKLIRDNLEAWRDLGSRAAAAVKQLRKSNHITIVNSDTAAAVALNELFSQPLAIETLRLVQHSRIYHISGVIESTVVFPLPDGQSTTPAIEDANRDGYTSESSYDIFVIETGGSDTMVVGVRTNGTVAFAERMSPIANS